MEELMKKREKITYCGEKVTRKEEKRILREFWKPAWMVLHEMRSKK